MCELTLLSACPGEGRRSIHMRTSKDNGCDPCAPGYASAWHGICVFFHRCNYADDVYKNVCLLVGAEIGTTTLQNHLDTATKAQSIDIL